ncbi:hypothetical protein [Croceiramulus getboli]
MPEKMLNHIELRSEEVQEILTKVPHWMIRWGNVVFLSLILVILFLSWLIKYPDIITSEAIITTQIPPQKKYAQKTGAIDAIFVEDNDGVNVNQVLAIIENTANYKDVYKLKSVIDTTTIKSGTFSFPIDSLPLLFLGDIESHFASFQNNYIRYKLNSDLQPFSNEAVANRYSISELNRRLKSLKAQRNLNKVELDLAKEEFIPTKKTV